jgi:hypothetical protein
MTYKKINQKFLQEAIRKAQSAGRKANNTINAMRQAPSSMRLPPGRRRQKVSPGKRIFLWLISQG